MAKNKDLRVKIGSWLEQIAKHEAKIAQELSKPSPNEEVVEKWRKDIRVFENEIAKAARKLPQGRKSKRR